ncbi:intracellular coagulation inhibitor 2-like [Uloborus diversus]|uniref:intracellular coagulation inhibitor 2-like n=1 Tax=Uloborus diversus TaxID=327109 RepID=UPI00240A6FAD|nr:intracellular coagulation inhibitor 2-like [Uloborus diversus]
MTEPADVSPLTKANNHLAVELMKLLGEEGKNVFFSPFSLSTAMAMLYLGTQGQTSKELRHALGYHVANLEDSDLTSSCRKYLDDLEKTPDSYVLSCANSIVSDKSFAVKEAFKSTVVETFKALLVEVDFLNEKEKAIEQINDWVSTKTQKMIPQLLDKLPPLTVMVLLNAVYFKGNWLTQFNAKHTNKEKFHSRGNEAKKVDMMHLKEEFAYMEEDSFKALELPYKGKEVAMMILLPHKVDGLKKLESKLSSSFVQNTKKNMYTRKVAVSLPKFRMEYSKSMVDDFKKMGVNKIFFPGGEFDGINPSKDLYVADIVHKAVLVVNEEGSEAAAATAVVMALRCAPKREFTFVADHPFLFVIYDTRSNLILFMGKVETLEN